MSEKVLSCKCGDCADWEVVELIGDLDAENAEHVDSTDATDIEPDNVTKHYLKCKTCGVLYPIHISIPEHDHLEWVTVDVA